MSSSLNPASFWGGKMKKYQCQNTQRCLGYQLQQPPALGWDQGCGGHWKFASQGFEAEWEHSGDGEGGEESGKTQKIPPWCSSMACTAPGNKASTWHLSGERVSCLETPNCVSWMAKVHFLCLGEGQKHCSIRAAARPKQEKCIGSIKQPGKCEASP